MGPKKAFLLWTTPTAGARTAAFVLECCMDSTTGAAIAKSVVRQMPVVRDRGVGRCETA